MIIEMWNNIVINGRIAQTLKWDKIIYLWKKKGVKFDPKFYRPITLVTAISKIIEGLLHLKIKQDLPCPTDVIQHAYKANRNIQTTLLNLDEKLSNSKKSAAVMFLNLKGAFESVDNISLTYYINKFSPVLSKIVKSYLTNRIATFYHANYPDDKPRLEYIKNRSTVWKNAKKGAPFHILGFYSIYHHYKLRNHSYRHSGPWGKYQFF